MSSVTTIPDHILQIVCFIVQGMILFVAFYGPIANRLWMLRTYLAFSLVRTLILVSISNSVDIQTYAQVHCVLQIIGHVMLMLMAVEVMGLMIARDKRAAAMFYSLATAFMIVFALSMIHLPTTERELAIFVQKSLALSLFVLMFTFLNHPKWYWPYTGIAKGLSVMLALDLLCVIAQQWSAVNHYAGYHIVHYAYPLASLTGYILWLRAMLIYREPVQVQGASLETLNQWKDNMRRYKSNIDDLIRKFINTN